MRRLKLVITCLSIFLVSAVLPLASAQALSPEAEEKLLMETAAELVCLCGCGNQLISSCTCGQAENRRQFLRQQIKQGKNKQQLLQMMVDKDGPEVLAAPPKEGLNWILWVVVPYILPLLAAVGLGWLLSKWVKHKKPGPLQEQTQPGEQAAPKTDAASERYKKQLEDELKDFDE